MLNVLETSADCLVACLKDVCVSSPLTPSESSCTSRSRPRRQRISPSPSRSTIRLNCTNYFILFITLLNSVMAVMGTDLEFDYDEMTKALKDSTMIHSAEKQLAKTRPCLEISDKKVTFLKAVSKRTKKLVTVSPLHQFDVAFCSPESETESGETKCAPESRCTTVYKWKPALTQSGPESSPVYVTDEILVPTGCMCFLGAEREDDPAPLIIL